MIVSLIIVFLVLLIFIIDWIPKLNTWQSRVKIGQFPSDIDWQNKITATSIKWLHQTPTIKLTDNKRLIIIDILKGNYKKTAIQHWQQAALVLGLTQHIVATNDEKAREKVNAFFETIFDASGNWKTPPKEIDSVILAYALFNCSWIIQSNYKPAYDYCYQLLLHLKGEDGTIAYRKHNPDYRYVDTIGFICPFLMTYGVVFQNEEAVQLAVRQIISFNDFGMLPNHNVPCHAYSVKTNLPSGLFGWGRGLGWYAIGLIDSWKITPNNHPDKERLTQSVLSFSAMILKFQNKNGSWNWQILYDKSQTDSSVTATLAYFLASTASIPEIAEVSKNAKEKAIAYLKSVTRRDGATDLSQGDTKGIGVYSQEFNILPFTQGFCLRAITS